MIDECSFLLSGGSGLTRVTVHSLPSFSWQEAPTCFAEEWELHVCAKIDGLFFSSEAPSCSALAEPLSLCSAETMSSLAGALSCCFFVRFCLIFFFLVLPLFLGTDGFFGMENFVTPFESALTHRTTLTQSGHWFLGSDDTAFNTGSVLTLSSRHLHSVFASWGSVNG